MIPVPLTREALAVEAMFGKRLQVRRVTLLRCKTRRHMDEAEARLIIHHQPPLNDCSYFPRSPGIS